LLWHSLTVDKKFPEEDRDGYYSVRHWEKKTEYGELYNYVCQTPMGILMPELLDELARLRQLVLNGTYYWVYRNIEYLRLVYCHEIPMERDYDKLAVIWDEYETKHVKRELEFHEYLYGLFEDEIEKT